MIIKKIELKDFLSHKDSVVQFKGSVNVIIGHNGAGKSSIIDGIIFGLFRDTLRGVRKQEDIVRRGATTGGITLELSDKGRTYIIKRNLSNRTAEDNITEVSENNKRSIIARGASTVTEKVSELLGLDKTTLESTVIIGQGKIESVFDDLPDTIKKVLKIDKIEELRDSRGPLKDIEYEIEWKLKTLDKEEEEKKKTEEEKKKKEEYVFKLREEIDRILVEKSELETRVKELNEKVKEGEEKQKKFIQIKSEINRLQSEIERLKRDVSEEDVIRKQVKILEEEVKQLDQLRNDKINMVNIKGKIELKKQKEKNLALDNKNLIDLREKLRKKNENRSAYEEYLQISNRLNELKYKENQYNKVVGQLENLNVQIQKIQRKIDNNVNETVLTKIEQEIEDLNKLYETLENEEKDLNKEYGERKGKYEELNKLLKNIDEVKGNKCPVCGRELDETHKLQIRSEIEKQLSDINAQLKQILASLNKNSEEKGKVLKELEEKRKEKDVINRKLSDYNNLKRQLEELSEERKQLEEKMIVLMKDHEEYEKLSKRLEELKLGYNEYLKYSDVDEKKIEELERKIKENKEEIDRLAIEVGEYEHIDVDKELQKINNKIQDLENKEILLKKLENKLALIEEKKQQMEKNIRELKDLTITLNSLGFNEEEFNKLREEKENIENKLNQLIADERQKEGQIEVLERDIKELEQKIIAYEENLKKKQKLREAYNKIKKLRDALSEKRLQAYLMSTVRKIVENRLNETLSKFDLSFTMVEVNFNEKNGIYAYTQNGQRLHINMLSGGERVSIAIALRLAIAKSLMNDIGFMILDEPTVNLDEYRKRELIDIIKSTTEVVPQIIVVTHDEELLQAGDYVLRLEKRGDSSKVIEEVGGIDQGNL